MTDNLLETPERAAIEDFLQRSNVKPKEKPTYDRVLGFLSGDHAGADHAVRLAAAATRSERYRI
jgi:hypothetical protein